MTFGLTSPFYQYYDFPEAICSEDKIYLAPRVEQSKNKKQFSKKQGDIIPLFYSYTALLLILNYIL